MALILRYDVSRNFRSKYFRSAFGGYVAGLLATIGVMNYFNAAQPALLYIVPGVLGAVLGHAWINREFKQVFDFSEEPEKAEGAEGEGDKAATEPVAAGAEEKKTK